MVLVELTRLRHAYVGVPGVSGLSVEQRKRLTLAGGRQVVVKRQSLPVRQLIPEPQLFLTIVAHTKQACLLRFPRLQWSWWPTRRCVLWAHRVVGT